MFYQCDQIIHKLPDTHKFNTMIHTNLIIWYTQISCFLSIFASVSGQLLPRSTHYLSTMRWYYAHKISASCHGWYQTFQTWLIAKYIKLMKSPIIYIHTSASGCGKSQGSYFDTQRSQARVFDAECATPWFRSGVYACRYIHMCVWACLYCVCMRAHVLMRYVQNRGV